MKHNKLVRLLSLAMVLLMLVCCFAACGDKDDTKDPATTTNKPAGPAEDTEAPLTGEELEYLPAEKDYKKREIKIAAPSQQAWGVGHFCHVDGSEDVINVALHERELLLDDQYGIILTLDTNRNSTNILTQIHKTASSQSSDYDLAFMITPDSMNAAMGGRLSNLLTMEALNLEASYYDQRIQQDFKIDDLLFHVTGDFDLIDELVTMGVLYNDSIYKDLGLYDEKGTPYEMVRNYTWTYDVMWEMASRFTVNEDSVFDINDKVGIVSENQAGYYIFMGAGIRPINNNNGTLTIAFTDGTIKDRATTILETLMAYCANEDFCIPARDFASDAPVRDAGANKDMFLGDRALFRTSSLSTTLNGMPDMASDFGILPIPMYESAQKAYYCWLNGDANWPLAVPKFANKQAELAEIIEIFCYYSRYGGDESLYEAFFERLSLAKICRKPDDRAMFALIFESKVYDIDQALKLMNVWGAVQGFVGSKSTVSTSTLDGLMENAGTKLAGYVKQFQMMNQ